MTFQEFKDLKEYLFKENKELHLELNGIYSFHYGPHSSMNGTYNAIYIKTRDWFMGNICTMNSTSFSDEQFYDFLVEKDLLRGLTCVVKK